MNPLAKTIFRVDVITSLLLVELADRKGAFRAFLPLSDPPA